MADHAATQITASHESWTDFLKTAARLYKYPYHEQLMIYAQRPDATACAGYEIWNEKMRRYIRRGRKGIALIDDSGDRPRIRYVFDISDTGGRENSRRPFLWQYRPEHEDAVTAALEQEYEISGEKGLSDQLEQIAGQLANEYWEDHQYDILHIVDGSFLEEYDKFNIGAQFRSAAAISTTYAVLSRCGLEPDEYFEHEDFLSIFDFNTPSTVAALGTAVSEASEKVLRQIEVTVKNQEREHHAERSATHGEQFDLQPERGLPDSRPDDHGADGEHRQIREDAEELPEGAPSGLIQQPAAVGEAVPAPVGDRADGDGAAGTHDAGIDEIGGSDGEHESIRPDVLGGPHEQPESAGRGNDSDGAYLQLSFFPSEQEQIQRINEAESEKPSAFSMPAPQKPEKRATDQADIDAAIQEWNGSTESKHIVAEYMREHARDKDTAAFLRAEYGDDLPTFPVTVGSTSTDLPWPKVQRQIAQLIRENRFYTQEEQAALDLSGQQITRNGDTITIGNGDASHEVDITLSDEQWAALQRAVPDSDVIPLPYKVGDTVYLDDKPFEITDIGTSDVQLRDPALAYPIFRAESRENFERLLRQDSRNGSITEFLAADLEHTDVDLREALTSGLLEQRDKEKIAGYFRENEGNTRVAQRLSDTYAGTSDTMELTTGETADFLATTTGFEVDIHDKYNSRRSARWEGISPILRALYQREQDGFFHEPALRGSANRDDTHPSTEVTLPETATQPSGKLSPESGVALPGEIGTVKGHIALEQPAAENFRITEDHLGEGGAKAKYGFNIAAIRTLKAIEAEGRTATPEEQETLSRYVGWGGIPQAFDPDNASWSKEYTELVGALTAEEYEMARASTLNAHYTSPTVIKAIYEAVGNMGFQTGNILEPACGVGNFFGLLPESMAASRLYGVELDSITGRIAKQLYPNANITVAGFETTDRRDFFDLAVGNVPFGSYKVSDRAYDKLGFPIHDYFFAKTLDQVRQGGVIAFVTSRYTMDKQSPEVRRYIAQRADLLGAIRLPSNAFKANAGTEVTTDILFLQKRDRPIDIQPDWVHLGQTEDGIPVNSYFADHPEMVLGTIKWDDKMHGDKKETTCEPFPDADLAQQLHEAVSHLQGHIEETELPDLGEDEEIDDSIPADPEVKNYSYTVVDGKVYYRENSRMVRPELNETAKARVMGMVELRDCVQKLIDRQLDEYASDAEIRKTQAELNTLYDTFSVKYGLINSRGNSLAFAEDSSYYLLCSLEVIDEDGKLERKADMFTKRTIRQRKIVTSVDTASEALSLSIAEKARVDMDYMATLTGKTPEALADELRGVIFRDLGEQDPASVPKAFYKLENIPFVTADEYLSGNVRRKLRLAKAIAEMRPDLAEKITPNIEALKAAQPKDLDASEIEVRLGATWIDKGYIQQFMEELLNPPSGVRDGIRVNYSSFTAEWSVSNKSSVGYNNVAAYVTYGTDRANAYRILEDSLNLRDTRIYDTVTDPDGKERRVLNSKETTLAQQKQQAVKDAFHDWIWKDPERRQTLTKKYNELFNSSRPREYDGRHLVFPGMNPEIKLREHQLNAVAHQLYGGNTLLAHVVGAGKTYEMIAAAMEGKRLGLCQKSLFAVPNHLTEQWASEFLRLYPSANILVTTRKDFEKRNRKKFCARIATGDYDAIIMGHSQFEKIPVSQERQKRLIQEQIWEIENGLEELKDSGAEQFTIKQLERTKKGLESRLKRLNDNSRKDDVVTFEQLGVDRLFVDEAHNYKNLFLYTKMRNVAGLSTTDAQKSSDMFLKCRYLDEITHSRGVVFATGTPVSNSMTELYTMMRYLQYETLKERNLVHFDCWASTFGETVTAIELAPEGTGYRARTRFARFYNLPELMLLFKEAADIKTADQLNLPTPTPVYHNEVAQPSEIQKEMVKKLSERAAAVHSGNIDPHVDNMLKITSDGRKLGLDQRVINPMLPDNPDSKVNMCVNNVFRFWHDGQDKKLTQLVFCDISTPKGRAAAKEERAVRAGGKLAGGTELHALQDASPEADAPEAFSVYSDIRDKLIARGVPAGEIAFIHDADTEIKKKELFAKVRAGQVRVLMGSTAKMGAGMNVQDLLIASHDLDCPWRPGDLEQRSGRIIRQYNTNPEGHIFRYVTEGTFDSYLWQTVENKQKFISQIMTSKSPVRSCEDIDETALSYAEIKALCAGDERIKEKMDLDMDVAKLKLMKANHQSQQFRLEDNLLKYFPEEIERNKGFIKGLETDMATLEAHPHPKDGFAGMVVRGDSLTDKDNAGAAILEACKEVKGLDPMEIGSYRGFTVSLSVEGFGQDFILTLKGQMTHRVTLGKDARGNLIRIDNALSDMPKRLQNVHAQLDNLHSQMDAAKAEIGKPFPQEAELAQKSARLAELNALLDIDSRAPAQRQASEVLEKSKRPSVLESLKTPCVCGTGKKPKHELAR
jgi:N12 class adenine-specific DNA methylase/adenine-specific DNA methylase